MENWNWLFQHNTVIISPSIWKTKINEIPNAFDVGINYYFQFLFHDVFCNIVGMNQHFPTSMFNEVAPEKTSQNNPQTFLHIVNVGLYSVSHLDVLQIKNLNYVISEA